MPFVSVGTLSVMLNVYVPPLVNVIAPNVAVFAVLVAVAVAGFGSVAPLSGLLVAASVNVNPSSGQCAVSRAVPSWVSVFVIFGWYVVSVVLYVFVIAPAASPIFVVTAAAVPYFTLVTVSTPLLSSTITSTGTGVLL